MGPEFWFENISHYFFGKNALLDTEKHWKSCFHSTRHQLTNWAHHSTCSTGERSNAGLRIEIESHYDLVKINSRKWFQHKFQPEICRSTKAKVFGGAQRNGPCQWNLHKLLFSNMGPELWFEKHFTCFVGEEKTLLETEKHWKSCVRSNRHQLTNWAHHLTWSTDERSNAGLIIEIGSHYDLVTGNSRKWFQHESQHEICTSTGESVFGGAQANGPCQWGLRNLRFSNMGLEFWFENSLHYFLEKKCTVGNCKTLKKLFSLK